MRVDKPVALFYYDQINEGYGRPVITRLLINQQGWLQNAICKPSPNYNQRPEGTPVSLLVIHNISLPPGEFGGKYICDFFANCLNPAEHPYFETISDLKVSAHLLIQRDGELVQFVSFDDRAWHAGNSCYEGAENCNDFAIGIELEGTDDISYTEDQYRALSAVTLALMEHYPSINIGRIVGHSDIAPDRKTDPGPAFDWPHYLSSLET